MREIRYRAWQPYNSLHRKPGMYIVESLEFYRLPHDGHIGEAFLTAPGEDAKSSEYFENIILMQYTGLKDKNGVEIYEGDIIKHTLWKIPVVVYWEYGGFMAKSATGELGKRSYTDGTLYDMQLPKCKVIGNIYENKDLLK